MAEKLAIEGGKPVREKPLPLHRNIGLEELEQLLHVIKTKNLFRWSGGARAVETFERKFAEYLGVKHAVASTSGTAALHVAVAAINPEPADEIITAPITDMGTIIAILQCNAIPVFADVDPETYCIDPKSVEERITDRTKAVIAVHLFGHPCDMDGLMKVCEKHGIYLIEDCAQAHLAEYKGKKVGTFGHINAFSFQQSKHLTMGDGGMTVTDDDELFERATFFADKGWRRGGEFREYLFLGINYRMTELQGAVGLAQLDKWQWVVDQRNRWGTYLTKLLSEIEGINPPVVREGCKHVYWFYAFTIDEEMLGPSRDFAQAVRAEGIPCGVGYIGIPIYLTDALRNRITYGTSSCPYTCPRASRDVRYYEGLCPNAEAALKRMLTVPINEHYTERDVEDIAEAIRKVAEAKKRRKREG